ncbi:phosphoenolpyruvate carboxykinase (GTP), partial [Candidatus Desantisbacteria bacterium]|nr:phosphoenolpyruvate carboxykinase (GTP) [Candidatus Desantisbacteria bacterium]
TDTNEPWWEGLDGEVPTNIVDWQGNVWDKNSGNKAAHPNSRFTVAIKNCPMLSKEFDNPKGVPISAIIFGGRRTKLVPLVVESFSWTHGVFLGARMGSETTAAALHQVGILRRDPMAMLPFCGYNMGDYFQHWLNVGKRLTNPPRIYSVNWFRVDDNGKFIWPGFGDNIRVIKWIIERVTNKSQAKETPIGLVPDINDFNVEGLNISKENFLLIICCPYQHLVDQWANNIKDIFPIEEIVKCYDNRQEWDGHLNKLLQNMIYGDKKTGIVVTTTTTGSSDYFVRMG